jgi:hypothetical protein
MTATDLYSSEDSDDEQVREVFAYFGRAMYAASCVEHGLTIALMQAELMSQVAGRVRREKAAPTRDEWEAMFDDFMSKQDGLMLGTLIARFKSIVRVSTDLENLLSETLLRRNELAHAFFRERAVDFAHSSGRLEMIADLERDHDLFVRADLAVEAAVAHVLPKLGYDPVEHAAQVEEISRSLLDEARRAREK